KEEIDRNAVEIKGQVASRGFVKGVVRLVKDATELGKVKKGDILVTSMTTTDFTPILDKISGLITDEGGLTCHAAIVSRELGIPCIIGTKHATKTLKDDDKIELDAEKGIIRKL
ncbi:MAG: PEP-utilizing enzyme, partial [Candidatus Woesearchaeota archaeon]|nr:PEP-utilizing enzyme [Candidatus Woesearchaeota archaeon]